MVAFRLARVVVHLLRGIATCALLFPFLDTTGRRVRIRTWSAKLLSLCRVRLEIIESPGVQTAPRALIVANHISWLDIFVINAMYPSRFVAKSDIRQWPLIGWMCEKAGTIFIARGKLRDVRRIYQGLVSSLQDGEHVAFFPEGTTGAQGGLLPFHANLFEAAIEAQVPVQPYALRYLDEKNELHTAANFINEMTFVQSMLTILKASPMTAQLILLPPIATMPASHRRELADSAHATIAAALTKACQPKNLISIFPSNLA